MPQIICTIDEYAATVRKKDTIWVVFNKVYNDVHAFKKELRDAFKYLDKENTDYEAQKEFLNFMALEFPNVEILEVMDLVPPGYLVYPYLGSYAINADVNSDVYKALEKKYGKIEDKPFSNSAVLWMVSYEDAQRFHKEREDMIDAEFGDDV